MPAFYKIEKENRLVLTTASGIITMAEALGHQERLAHDPDFDPNFGQLLDFTHVTKIELTTEDVRRLAEGSLFTGKARRAILVNSDIAYGLARMFEIIRESAGETGIKVFRNLDDALEWILARQASA